MSQVDPETPGISQYYCALLNITTRGQDDNGKSITKSAIKLVTPFQAGQIQRLISQWPATTQEWFSGKYGSAVQVPQADFDKLRASLVKRAVQ
ncbi:MAG: hypothetical protein M1154_16130 [Gammaproteobacteria bacterium]|nr:hypothetical protein [Gammaproteobacteria bacterium]